MAVLELSSDELDADYRGHPINDHGKIRVQYFNVPAVEVEGDAETTIDLCDLPPGKIRVIPVLSHIKHSAFGAGRTLDIGHRVYQKRDNAEEDEEAENLDAFCDGLDVAAAANGVGLGANLSIATKYDLYSKGGVRVTAQVKGASIPVGATLSGFIAYVHE